MSKAEHYSNNNPFLKQRSTSQPASPTPSSQPIPRQASVASFASTSSTSTFPATTTATFPADARSSFDGPPPEFPLTLNGASPTPGGARRSGSTTPAPTPSVGGGRDSDSRSLKGRKRVGSSIFSSAAKFGRKSSRATLNNGAAGGSSDSNPPSPALPTPRQNTHFTSAAYFESISDPSNSKAHAAASYYAPPKPPPALPQMPSFDDRAPMVPLSSKQAQLLGVGGAGGKAQQALGINGLEGYSPLATPTSPRPTRASSPQRGDDNSLLTYGGPSIAGAAKPPKGKGKPFEQPRGDEGSVKEKKKGALRSMRDLLARKSSRPDLRDGNVSDGHDLGEFTGGMPPMFDHNIPLPPKLQARGDTADVLPMLASSKKNSGRNGKKPGRSPTKAPTPQVRQPSVFGTGAILLDTNLDSMDGIIAPMPTSVAPSRSGSLSGASGQDVDGVLPSERNQSIAGSIPNSSSFSHSLATSPDPRRPSVATSHRISEAGYTVPSSDPPSTAGSNGPRRFREGSGASAIGQSATGFWTTPSAAFGETGPPSRPGLGGRASSTFSVNLASGLVSSSERRPSLLTNGVTTATGVVAPKDVAGAWTAPDSWAVKGDTGSLDHDSSDDDQDEEQEDGDSETGLSPVSRDTGMFGNSADVGTPLLNGVVGRPGTSSGGRPNTRAGRPGTSDGYGRAGQRNFIVRVLWGDANTATIPAPLTATVADLIAILSRKFPGTSSNNALFLREKGTERKMGLNEKPVLLQKRRFEQAGYTELDKLEELGREDNSYLCKLVFKSTQGAPQAGREVDLGDSREFVDLSGKGLETIPIYLYRAAHEMVTLNLSKNRPFDLPTDFIQLCSSLREVHLSHMGLKRLPQAIKECASLTRLDISNNHIVELEHISLDELSGLTSLKCHNNRLWMLPEYFNRFKALKYLNLSNNRFDTMPLVVCDIQPLVELDISFNTITFLPAEIGQLVNVERLVLLANNLTAVPSTFSALIRLKEFDCRRNSIADLSPIGDVPNLEVLRCEFNQASVLDAQWSHMKILTASNNSITRFALSGTGNTLTTLNLSHAKLSSLAVDMFDHLGSVENLVFDSNQIRVLPEGVGSLANLQHLSMRNNLLDVLPSTIGRLQRLQTLHISGNNLHELPVEIWLCSSLMTINASSNLLKDFADVPMMSAPTLDPGLEELDSRKLSTLSKAPSTASGRMAPPLALSLQRLYLGDNRIIDDVFAPISLMTELRILNLSFNDIFEIPSSSLFKCQQLEELYLSGNKLTSLPPEDLERLVNLKLLYLNGNKLQTLPSEFGKIKKLFALDVGSNVLKYNIANWPYDWNWNWNLELRYLNLSGNKRLEVKPGHQNDVSNLPLNSKRRNLADFSALTKLHILGLMDVTLMIPSLPDESEDRRVRTSTSEINEMGYGIADTLGSRVDALSLVDIVVPRFRSKDDEAIFGLFDAVTTGQKTGAKLVKYLQDSFTAVFTLELSRLKSGEVTSDALRRAFLNINRDYGNLLIPAFDNRRKNSEISLSDRGAASVKSGASGIIVYIRRKKLYVANAGNALAVISGRGGSARLIAKKHEPFEESEVARIRTAEGWISHRGFVNDEVDISRSFGFYNVFPAVNSSPNYEEIDLADTDEFVIIANRGLWEHMSYQTAVDVARTERNDPMAAAAKLRDLAISYGSSANIMVMVLAVRDLFKAKKDYRSHRSHGGAPDEDNYYQTTQIKLSGRGGRKDEGAGERYLNLLDREVAPPVGLVALVFTDIRNSTALWDTNAGMQTAIRMHNQLLRRQLRAIGGYEVKTEGDAFMVSFPTVTSALLWSLTVQLELLREDWPQEILDSDEGKEVLNSRGELLYRGLSVRMGMHWGAPVCEADPITRRMDYFGPMVNRASRISAVAEGGQLSASQDVIDIIQEVVMERKPAPSSLDSDSGEESDEEEWLDANEKRDVLALRRLGFGIAAIGERRLKGLETPEMLSLIYPTALKDRIKLPGDAVAQGTEIQAEVQDPSSSVLDITLVRALAKVVQRLEAATSTLVHPADLDLPSTPKPGDGALVLAKRKVVNPASLAVIIRPDVSDEELSAVFESLLHRIENTLSTLVLHQMGPFVEVLAALGGAVKNDPTYIVNALSRYGALMAST